MPRRPRPDTVPIPDTHDPSEPAVRFLLENPGRLLAGGKARPRALRLIQGLADEARLRGYALLPPGSSATFRIDIGQDSFSFILSEEQDAALSPPHEHVAAARYSWQRVEPQPAQTPSGRLVLELLEQPRRTRWADRNRWRLQDKFPLALALVEQQATDAAAQRNADAAEHARQVALWEQAVPRAREQHLNDLNIERLESQIVASEQAARIRAYCCRVVAPADTESDSDSREQMLAWVASAERYAAAIDPLNQSDAVRYESPVTVRPEDVDRYMPAGMTVRHPPGLVGDNMSKVSAAANRTATA